MDAQICIYDVSVDTHFGFCCDIDEETSRQLACEYFHLSVIIGFEYFHFSSVLFSFSGSYTFLGLLVPNATFCNNYFLIFGSC